MMINQLQTWRQERTPEGLYQFFRVEFENDVCVTIRLYGDKLGACELFHGQCIGENVRRRFDKPGMTFDEVVQDIANFFQTDIEIMKPHPILNQNACLRSTAVDRVVKYVKD